MDYTDLRAFVGTNADDDTYVIQCWSTAQALVDEVVGTAIVPTTVLDRAYLVTGSELFHARNAPNGVAAYNNFDGAPVRINRDPLTPAYALLAKYVVIGL